MCERCKKPLINTKSGFCQDCGKEVRREQGLMRHRRLMELANGHPGFEYLFEQWRQRDDDTVYAWAYRNEDLLRTAATCEIDRAILVRLPFATAAIKILCAHLELAGLLEPVKLDVARFMLGIERAIDGIAGADAVLLKEYARLLLLPRLQRRCEYGERTDPSFKAALTNVRYLVRCSTRMITRDEGARSLATMNQEDLDALWNEATYHWRMTLKSFVRWFNRRTSMPALQLKKLQKPARTLRMTQDELTAHHTRATSGDDDVAPRLAVLLALRYLQQAGAIGALHVSQLADDCTKIRFGARWLDVEEPMQTLLRQQLASRRDQSSCWVFPSAYYRGNPTSWKGVGAMFSRMGMPAQRARGSTIVSLLRSIEYPMLANLLGLDVGTLAQWADLVGSSSEDQYVAMRRTQDTELPATVTIADRVYAEYRGQELAGPLGRLTPARLRSALPDEEFENAFSIQRVRLRSASPLPMRRST